MGYGTSLGTSHEDEISYVMEKGLTDKQLSDSKEMAENNRSGDFQSRFYGNDTFTMPLEASRKLTDALKTYGSSGTPENDYNTKLTPDQESKFTDWKAQNAPKDSGADYDLRGAFQAGISPDTETGHWPDTYKKPNHPTFSDQSQYAKYAPDQAGTWDGDRFVPPAVRSSISDDLFGTGSNDIRPALKQGIQSVIDMVKYPGDVASGAKPPPFVVDPDTGEMHTSHQAIEWATNTAATMIGAPTPVAAKVADGTLGSFMGVRSKTIDKTRLYKAQEMEMNGVHPDDIWEDTNTFRGADGRWRQEINDKRSSLKEEHLNVSPATDDITTPTQISLGKDKTVSIPNRFDSLSNPKATLEDLVKDWTKPDSQKTLGYILHHPTLYDAYPWLQNIKVYPLPKDTSYYGLVRGGNEIHMAELTPDQFRSTLLHEVQHLIQTHEGFAQGANPDMFIPKGLKQAEDDFIKVREESLKGIKDKGFTDREINTIKWASQLDNQTLGILKKNGDSTVKLLEKAETEGVYNPLSNIAKSEKLLDEAKRKATEMYKTTMGEVESRNVQARLDMDATMRFLNHPRSTEEMITPRYLQHDPHATGK